MPPITHYIIENFHSPIFQHLTLKRPQFWSVHMFFSNNNLAIAKKPFQGDSELKLCPNFGFKDPKQTRTVNFWESEIPDFQPLTLLNLRLPLQVEGCRLQVACYMLYMSIRQNHSYTTLYPFYVVLRISNYQILKQGNVSLLLWLVYKNCKVKKLCPVID